MATATQSATKTSTPAPVRPGLVAGLLRDMAKLGWTYVDQVRDPIAHTPLYTFSREEPDGRVASVELTLPQVVAMTTNGHVTPDLVPEDLLAAGWHFIDVCSESAPAAWRVVNERLQVDDVVYARLVTAIKHARKVQTEKTLPPGSNADPAHRFTRPAGVPIHQIVPLALIVKGRWQPRQAFDDASLQELADSIRMHGVLTPLKVFVAEDGKYELIAGERRARAARMAGLDAVPVEICELTAREAQEISILDNLQREDLTPIEEGTAFEQLIQQLGISENELAKRLGKNRAYIQQRRALVKAAPALQEAYNSGTLGFSQVRGILASTAGDSELQASATAAVERVLRRGSRVTEQEAGSIADAVVLEQKTNMLQDLGWIVKRQADWHGPMLVYARRERPRAWTGAEILEAARTERRPATVGTSVASTFSVGDKARFDALLLRVDVTRFAPWALWWPANDQDATRICDARELAAKVDEVNREVDAVAARFAALAYELRAKDGCWELHKGTQSRDWIRWADLQALLVEAEAGTPITLQPVSGSSQRCNTCKQEGIAGLTYNSGGYICAPCKKERQAAARAEHARVVVALDNIILPGLAFTDVATLRLLAYGFARENANAFGLQHAGAREIAAHIQTLDEATLRAAMPALVLSRNWGNENYHPEREGFTALLADVPVADAPL